jgi:hypothetical protein
LVRFGSAEDQFAVDLDYRLTHVDPATHQIDVLHSQCGCLTPSQTTVGKHLEKGAVLLAVLRQGCDLLVGQVPALSNGQARKAHPRRWIADDLVASCCVIEHCGEQVVGGADA